MTKDKFVRFEQRAKNEIRKVKITPNYIKGPAGSVLIEMGDTKVICNATVETGVPRFLKGQGKGWVTAEYGMLPASTGKRMDREAARGKQSGRTQEIQRLIGRSLRAVIDLAELGENTILLDCDVIQADGGTRTASITGAFVALMIALADLKKKKIIAKIPVNSYLAAISVGILENNPILDLCYQEDSKAQVDMNVIMTSKGEFVEIQGTGEEGTFSYAEMEKMLSLAKQGVNKLIAIQKQVLKSYLR